MGLSRRHRPAKAQAQQQNTKDPQLWPTNLLPRALPACPACHGANPRLGPQGSHAAGCGPEYEEWRSAPNTHLEQFLFLPFETLDPSPWSSRLVLCLHGWVGRRKGPGEGELGDFWQEPSLLLSPTPFLRLCLGVLSWGGRSSRQGLEKSGSTLGEGTGLPNRGLSETKILWDAIHPPPWKLTEKKRTSGEKPVKWE